jgi:hypothetical protein
MFAFSNFIVMKTALFSQKTDKNTALQAQFRELSPQFAASGFWLKLPKLLQNIPKTKAIEEYICLFQ